MNSELKNKLDEFIDDFLQVKEVKQYLLLKKEILESNEIKELEVIRYSMTKMSDKMVDDLCEIVYVPRAKRLFKPAEDTVKNDGATKCAPSS